MLPTAIPLKLVTEKLDWAVRQQVWPVCAGVPDSSKLGAIKIIRFFGLFCGADEIEFAPDRRHRLA